MLLKCCGVGPLVLVRLFPLVPWCGCCRCLSVWSCLLAGSVVVLEVFQKVGPDLFPVNGLGWEQGASVFEVPGQDHVVVVWASGDWLVQTVHYHGVDNVEVQRELGAQHEVWWGCLKDVLDFLGECKIHGWPGTHDL